MPQRVNHVEQLVESCLPRKEKVSMLFTFTIDSDFCFGFLDFFTLIKGVTEGSSKLCPVVGREETQKKVEGRGKLFSNWVNQALGLQSSSLAAKPCDLAQGLASWSNLFSWKTRKLCLYLKRFAVLLIDA